MTSNIIKQDISIVDGNVLKLGDAITTDIAKAVNQYIMFLLTQSGTDVFYDTLSPLADIGQSNINLDLDTFKSTYMISHSGAEELLLQNYPNIIMKLENVLIYEDKITIVLDVKDNTTGATERVTI